MMKTASYTNKINFYTDEELRLEPITLTETRLDAAYKQLNIHVPGAENLIKITKQLKHQGLQASEKSSLNKILNGGNDHDINVYLRTQSNEGIKLKGLLLLVALAHLFNLRVHYFSTRKHARIINPSGKKIVAVLHHVDSYLCTSTQWFSLEDTPDHKVSLGKEGLYVIM
ncbi:hypothetical protein BDB00DRAFT_335993 [Zychaea mexicana]|uniref:uncharacterized protein n=1 Tax=Zychaea mexicana TaxID=64656 RepID=UPI0022FE2E89|nr:uncharacterized protein BDB00DRAFT_335993 [Zychaea mexicana]KAI9494154.1 hypothetical protein BDB00DRAFT_335993 [Zychaea mexicana]